METKRQFGSLEFRGTEKESPMGSGLDSSHVEDGCSSHERK